MEANFYHTFNGTISRGFTGHLSFQTIIPSHITALKINFSFSKRELENTQDALYQVFLETAAQLFAGQGLPPDEILRIKQLPKSEINVSVLVNGFVSGSAHRNSLIKEITISPATASLGFIPCRVAEANLEIVMHVFNILNNDTPYTLSIEGKADGVSHV